MLDLGAQRVPRLKRHVHFNLRLANHALQSLTHFDGDAFEFLAVTCRILSTFTRVALAANAVHRNGQCGMRLRGDGTQRHRTGCEAFDDFTRRLNAIDGDGFTRINLELKQTAKRHVALVLVVDDLCVFFVGVEIVGACAVLQFGNRIRGPHVVLSPCTPCVLATRVQHVGQNRVAGVSSAVRFDGLLCNLKHTNALHPRSCSGEVLLHGARVDANGLKKLRTAVTHVGRDAHLGHDLGETLADRFDVVVDGLLSRQISGEILVNGLKRLHGQIGVNGLCAVTRQHSKVMNLFRRTGLHHQTSRGPEALTNQVLVNGREGQERRHGHLRGTDRFVADDQNVSATLDGVHRGCTQGCQLGLHTLLSPRQGVGDVQRDALEFTVGVVFNVTQLLHIRLIQDGLRDFKSHGRVDLVDVQQIGLGTNEGDQRHHNRFANGVDGRVGHLRKELLEVVVERFIFRRQHSQWAVIAHGANALLTVGSHGGHQEFDVLLGVTKRLLEIQESLFGGLSLGSLSRRSIAGHLSWHIVQTNAQILNPLFIRLGVGQTGFQLFIIDHATLLKIDQEHLARLESPLSNDLALGHRQYTRL